MNHTLTALLAEGRSVNITGLRGSAVARSLALATASQSGASLCVVPSEANALHLAQDLALFTDLPVLHFPGDDIPPYAPLSPDSQTVADRLAALFHLHEAKAPCIVVAAVEALQRRLLPSALLDRLAELVMRGEDSPPEQLSATLAAAGYEAASLVQSAGEYSVRGGILDVFPPGFALPVRLDFFGDTVESIRTFDPISQRSVGELAEVVLLPASDILFPPDQAGLKRLLERFRAMAEEYGWDHDQADTWEERLANRQRFPGIEALLPLFAENPVTLLDYLPPASTCFLVAPDEIAKSCDLCHERIKANHAELTAAASVALPPEQLFLAGSALPERLAQHRQIRFYDFPHAEMAPGETLAIPCSDHTLLRQRLALRRRDHATFPELIAQIQEWLAPDGRVAMACRSRRHAEHMAELLGQHNLPLRLAEAPCPDDGPPAGQLSLFDQPITAGFDLVETSEHWLSESELFGELRLGARRKKTAGRSRPAASFEELQPGDVVVHTAHGLGIFEGIVNMEIGGIANDFFQLAYRDGDRLYVPVDQLKVISKYKGLSDTEPKLDRLGGKAWQTKRDKVREEVWQVAQDLLDLYARRSVAEGLAFSPPDEMFHELEESFPYDETPGQLKAINEVLDDLTSPRPMDRLVCGDVGYGKTEVAVRAAFKVIGDGGQVAMLVPTTVLAEQHAATFRERLAGFAVRVESLTRFRTTAEQKKIVQEVAAGRVDLVIGTHRLLSADVAFKRLGLLIIDEEHRFGVAHKEKLKKLKTGVDVLTLTATPIPRTLQLSLLNIRDLSVISSPPEHRRPVKTFIAKDDDLVIREAIQRELQRGGQVFLVHNRVHSIHQIAGRVQRLAPEARLAVAHGQMPPKELEEIMVRFVRREIDVLICTTIIESGLDIPNANTIIITRADRHGLAEIYQLRGRVGRSREQAYAYLLVPSLDSLSQDAQQRLRALMDYNELGGGFKLALSDLQIRGGGNILGISQSGNIAAVGYDLYLELLQQTVLELKHQGGAARKERDVPEPEISLRMSAFLPASFIPSTEQRYIAYRRLTSADSEAELADLRDEFEDRYGRLPQEAITLFDLLALKTLLRRLAVVKLEQGPTTLVFTFHDKTPVRPERLLALLQKHPKQLRLTPESKLVVNTSGLNGPEEILAGAQNILATLMEDDIS
ncbi:MAG: transcription-repair coupling factor [Thermodesulfobacteriota bacterium]